MKNANVNKNIKKAANNFTARKDPVRCIDDLVSSMDTIGGITGFNVESNNNLRLVNHNDTYTVPVRFEEHGPGLSKFGKQCYQALEILMDTLTYQGVPKGNMQFHLGKNYSSKHHDPRRYR